MPTRPCERPAIWWHRTIHPHAAIVLSGSVPTTPASALNRGSLFMAVVRPWRHTPSPLQQALHTAQQAGESGAHCFLVSIPTRPFARPAEKNGGLLFHCFCRGSAVTQNATTALRCSPVREMSGLVWTWHVKGRLTGCRVRSIRALLLNRLHPLTPIKHPSITKASHASSYMHESTEIS